MALTRHIPNTITLLNLLSGTLAIVASFHTATPFWGGLPGWQWAAILIGAAAVFDFADGFAARLLHAYSALGKELDSLSDLISFGVAPSLLVFNTMYSLTGHWTAYLALFIAAMGALRLARFNIDTRQSTTFIGLPIPANAIFWIGATAFVYEHGYPGDAMMLPAIAAMALLMVSGVQMFSLKFRTWGWRANFRRYIILLAAAFFLLTQGLPGLMWTIILYIVISLVGRKQFA